MVPVERRQSAMKVLEARARSSLPPPEVDWTPSWIRCWKGDSLLLDCDGSLGRHLESSSDASRFAQKSVDDEDGSSPIRN